MKIRNNVYSMKSIKDVEKLANRPYRIALDLGVGSIGYAVGALASTNDNHIYVEELILSGVRIFSSSKGAAERRQKRGQRNVIRHKRHRLTYLWKILAERNLMLPYVKETSELDTNIVRFSEPVRKLKNGNVYSLRYKGLFEKLNLDEIGFCVYHIANHRGSSSVRTFLDMDVQELQELKKNKSKLELVEARQANNQSISFIEILHELNKDGIIGYRNTNDRMNIPLPKRDVILVELNKLLATQKLFYPEVLTDEYCERIVKAVNYENEKLVPEVGNCPYFPDEPKLPKCHFLNEERRLWEALNNARIKIPQESKGTIVYVPTKFSQEDKEKLYKELRNGVTLTGKMVKTLLPEYKDFDIILQGKEQKTSEIKGFRFKSLERKSFWNRLSNLEQDNFFALWVNCPDDMLLKKKLIDEFHLTEEEVTDALKTVQLISDYGPVGKSATEIIMRYIKEEGLTWTESLLVAEKNKELHSCFELKKYDVLPYYGEVLTGSTKAIMGKAWHSAFEARRYSKGFICPNTAKDEEKFGRIANPVVHQTLNEVRKLVNEIISLFGYKPSEIVVEVARSLKVGLEKREDISRTQKNNETHRKELFEKYCKPHNLSQKYIQHFYLLETQGMKCPYCLETINPDGLVRNAVDIDHILPEHETADSSFNNLVLAHKNCNAKKGKRSPFKAFYGTDKWAEILHYLEENQSMRSKRWRFMLDDEEYKMYLERKGFLSRFASDNAYIAKACKEYLSCLFDRSNGNRIPVYTMKGGETAVLRKAWGLNQIGYELGTMHLKDTEALEYISHKNRTDHRHHAIDAITMLYATRGYSQLINTLTSRGIPLSVVEKKIPVPMNLKRLIDEVFDESYLFDYNSIFFTEIAVHIKQESRISIKYDTDFNGELLKGWTYGIIGKYKDEIILCTQKSVAKIEDRKKLKKQLFGEKEMALLDDSLKEKLLKFQIHNLAVYEAIEENIPKALKVIQDENKKNVKEGKRTIKESEKNVELRAKIMTGGKYYDISKQKSNKLFLLRDVSEKGKGFVVDTGRNLCIDLFHDNTGKLCGEIIRKVQAMDKDYVPEYKRKGFHLYERIYQGDTLEVDLGEKAFSVPAPISSCHKALVRVDTFTETKTGFQIYVTNLYRSGVTQDSSFTLTTVHARNARKVVLSSLGYPLYVSQVLKDKT